MRKIVMISAVLLALGAAGCAGNPPVAADSSPDPVTTVAQGESTEPAGDPGETARQYMEALAATDNPKVMRAGLDHAAKGSPAFVYLTHQANIAEAGLDGGMPMDGFNLTPVTGGFEMCDPFGAGDEACGTFADFVAVDGRVSNLTVNGEDLGPRLTAGNGQVVKEAGVSAEFLTAYNAASGSGLWVTVRVTSSSQPMDLWVYEASYRAPDGKQRQATDAWGPYQLGEDSNAVVALQFAAVEPGGQITLGGADSVEYLTEFELEIQVG